MHDNVVYINNLRKLDTIVNRDESFKYARDAIKYCHHILKIGRDRPELARHYHDECRNILNRVKKQLGEV